MKNLLKLVAFSFLLLTQGLCQTQRYNLLQITDTHLNSFKWLPNSDPRYLELKGFIQTFLKNINPKSIIWSGDITDSQGRRKKYIQREEDWQEYQKLQKQLNLSGIDSQKVFDIRGNHDSYDVIYKQSEQDYFEIYGVRSNKTSPINIYAIKAKEQSDQYIDSSFEQWLNSSEYESCPAFLLVSIDMTPEIGLRGVTNFLGQVDYTHIKDLYSGLSGLRKKLKQNNCNSPIISYGHYPLAANYYREVMQSYHHQLQLGLQRLFFGQQLYVPPSSPYQVVCNSFDPDYSSCREVQKNQKLANNQIVLQDLKSVLTHYGVQMYLNGHLHVELGKRLYQMLAKQDGSYLAELESGDWKVTRRFRILTVDQDVLGFYDLRYFSLNNSKAHQSDLVHGQDYEIRPVDGTLKLNIESNLQVLPMITMPPDDRFAPLSAQLNYQQIDKVRAQLINLNPTDISKQLQSIQVSCKFTCDGQQQSLVMNLVDGANTNNPYYETQQIPRFINECSRNPKIQVIVSAPDTTSKQNSNEIATSEIRSVFNSMTKKDGAKIIPQQQKFTFMQSLGRFIALQNKWSDLGLFIFWTGWLGGFVLLVIPTFFPDSYKWAMQQTHKSLTQQKNKFIQFVVCCFFSVFNGLFLISRVKSILFPLIGYYIYMLFGPWFIGPNISSQSLSYIFLNGVIQPLSEGYMQKFGISEQYNYLFIMVAECRFLSLYIITTTLDVLVIWLALRLNFRYQQQQMSVVTKKVYHIIQLLILVFTTFNVVQAMNKIQQWFGYQGIIISPVGIGAIILYLYLIAQSNLIQINQKYVITDYKKVQDSSQGEVKTQQVGDGSQPK